MVLGTSGLREIFTSTRWLVKDPYTVYCQRATG